VAWGEGGDIEGADADAIVPGDFDDAREAAGDERAGVACGDDGGAFAREACEGGAVEVVEVRVGEEDQVDRRE
jgi:hypothetical protein